MKKIISALVSLAIVIGCLPMTFALADGTDTTATFNLQGLGTAESPYLITDAADLKAMRTAVNDDTTNTGKSLSYYKLTNNIDLENAEWIPIGVDSNNDFRGTFDGNGYVVKNFKITSNYSYAGFFGHGGSWDYKITVKNLGIENAEITANGTKGVMLGRGAGYFTNCYVKNSMLSGTGVAGGFIGTARHTSKFTNCYVYDVEITQVSGNSSELGGFCGKLENSNQEYTFTNCYSAKVSVTNPGSGKYSPFYPFLNNTNRYQEKTKSDGTIEPAVVPVITNCYSADTHFSGKDGQNQPIKYKPEAAGGVEGATLEGICAALVTDGSAYTSDPSVNGGYPYLKNVSVWDGTTTNTNFAGGGTEDNPYLITSAAEFAGLAKLIADTTDRTGLDSVTNNKIMYLVKTNTYYKLTCDIDLNSKEWTPIGNVQYRFDGIFDGDGHTVKNVSMTQEKNAAGLFGATGKNARILNLGVDGVSLKTKVGSLGNDAFVARCVGFGGLAGSIMTGGSDTKPMIENCFAKNVVIEPIDKQMGNNHSGGLVGNVLKESDSNNTFYISNSYTYNVTIKNYIDKGAFIGCNNCVLTYNGNGHSCGECVPNIKNCYAGGMIDIVDVHGNRENDNGAKAQNKKFAFGNFGSANADGLVNCYTSEKIMNEDILKAYYSKINYEKSAVDIRTALVTDGSAYKTDSAINGDFPSLKWENAENIVSHKDIIIAAVSESENANNNVQVTVSAKGDTANKTVYVATYDGSGRLIDVDSIALSEFTSNTAKVTNVTADGAANIKVFVWDSNMNSVATMFSRK